MRPRLVAALLVMVAAICAVLVWPESDREYERVQRGTLVVGVDVVGTLEAVESSLLGPPQIENRYQFKISMMAPEGAEVAFGTPVLAFDPSELLQELEEARNEAESARKEVEKKQVDLAVRAADHRLSLAEAEARLRRTRLKAERPETVVAAIELDKSELDLELATADLEQLKAEVAATTRAGEAELETRRSDLAHAESKVADATAAIERMTVTAPRGGIVIYVTNWRSEKKKVGDSCYIHEKVLEIPAMTRMVGDGEIEEAQAGSVRVGQPVSLRLDAHPDLEYRGRVASISHVVHEKRRSPLKVADVEVELESTDAERMRPGMRFRGEIEIDRAENVLLVPLDAVDVTIDGPVVWTRSLRGPSPRQVTLGRRSTDQVEVLDGVDEGDPILLEPPGETS